VLPNLDKQTPVLETPLLEELMLMSVDLSMMIVAIPTAGERDFPECDFGDSRHPRSERSGAWQTGGQTELEN
jgi:hypothetical protein